MDDELALSIEELAERVGVPVRTVRFYISAGLLPSPGTRGKGTTYGEEHLLRLQLARRLAERRVPVSEMAETLSRLSLDEVRALLAEEDRRAADLRRTAREQSPGEYVSHLLHRARSLRERPEMPMRRVVAPAAPADWNRRMSLPAPSPRVEAGQEWRRWELAPGMELHVRADREEEYRHLIARLLQMVEDEAQRDKR